jgi:hypothetical protein
MSSQSVQFSLVQELMRNLSERVNQPPVIPRVFLSLEFDAPVEFVGTIQPSPVISNLNGLLFALRLSFQPSLLAIFSRLDS